MDLSIESVESLAGCSRLRRAWASALADHMPASANMREHRPGYEIVYRCCPRPAFACDCALGGHSVATTSERCCMIMIVDVDVLRTRCYYCIGSVLCMFCCATLTRLVVALAVWRSGGVRLLADRPWRTPVHVAMRGSWALFCGARIASRTLCARIWGTSLCAILGLHVILAQIWTTLGKALVGAIWALCWVCVGGPLGRV